MWTQHVKGFLGEPSAKQTMELLQLTETSSHK